MKSTLAWALLCIGAPSWAQTAPASPATSAAERGEPLVRHTVIEDDGAKIEELRVRGQVQRVVVTPKIGMTRSYEIVISRSGRDPVDGTGGANSAAGKRVWNVFSY